MARKGVAFDVIETLEQTRLRRRHPFCFGCGLARRDQTILQKVRAGTLDMGLGSFKNTPSVRRTLFFRRSSAVPATLFERRSPPPVSEAHHCFLVDDEGLDEPVRRAGARYFDANRKHASRPALEALHVR